MKHIRSLILALVLSVGLAPAFAQAPPPVPALPDAERRTSYIISASTCACAIGFQLYQDSTDVANWLTVYIDGVQIPQSGNWNITSPSGSLSTLPRPISNAVLTFTTARTGTVQIVGAQRPRRLSEYAENRGVAARDLNQAINGIEAQLREMWDRQFRTVQAPPGETLSLLPPLSGRASMGACFDSSGNLAPCVAASGSFVAGTGIGFTGTNPTTISNTAATYSAGNGVIFTGTNPTVISVSASSGVPIIPSRAIAIGLDLSAYTVVKTGGYATAGDRGDATFVKVGAVPFKDTYVTAGTVAGGSGYGANQTYNGVPLGAGAGLGCMGRVTVTGGAVTAVDITGNYCAGYAVGNALIPNAANMAGTGSGATFTITSISSPGGSFVDSVANNWQIVADASAFPNVRQYGAKLDWDGTDATATNDILAFRSAIAHAIVPFSSSSPIIFGNTVIVPKGAALLCAGSAPFTTLLVSSGVILKGAGVYGGTTLKQCTAEGSNTHFITLCNPNSASGEFGCRIEDMGLQMNGSSDNTIAAVYSKSGQQFPLVDKVYIQPGLRGCVKYEVGTGGASNAIFQNFDCEQSDASTNVAFSGNSSGTQIVVQNAVFGCAPGICGAGVYAINAMAGNFIVQNVHVENHQTPINVATTGTQMLSKLSNLTLVAGCVDGIRLDVTNPNNTVLFENIESSCSNSTILNGHAGGANLTGHIMKQLTCNPGAPCN